MNAAEWKKIILEACASMKQNGSYVPLNASINENGGGSNMVENTNSNIVANGNYSNSSPIKNNEVTANGQQQFSPINNLNSSNYNVNNANGSQNNIYNYSPNQNGQQYQNTSNNYNPQYSQSNNNNQTTNIYQSNIRNPLDVIAERKPDSEIGISNSGYALGRE